MPASEIDFAQLAIATGQTEADLQWMFEQLCPRGVGGAQLQAASPTVAILDDGTEGIAIVEDFIAYATIPTRAAEFLPIAGSYIQFGIAGTVETLTATMGAAVISLALDSAGTIHVDTVGAVYKYARSALINRRRL